MIAKALKSERTGSRSQGYDANEILQDSTSSTVEHDTIDFCKPVNMNDPKVKDKLQQMRDRYANFELGLASKQTFCIFSLGVLCCILFSSTCVMEGYGMVVVTGFYSVPAFKRDFGCIGDRDNLDNCEAELGYQTGLILSIYCGQLVGLCVNGYLVEAIGYKKTMLATSLLMGGFIFVSVFSNSWPTFIFGQFLCGIPWGIYQTLATNYASDICPTPIRGYVLSSVSLCWIIGQLIGSAVQFRCLHMASYWAYKLPLSLQWVWLLPILGLLWLTPESPWWLVRRGRHSEARQALERLWSKSFEEYSVDDQLAFIICTNQEEVNKSGDKMGYLECFKGNDRRRTVIVCIAWAIQNASGSVLFAYSTYFFQQAGLGLNISFQLTIVQYGAGILSNCVGWYLMGICRRRTMHIGGLIGMLFCLVTIGTLGTLDKTGITGTKIAGAVVAASLLCMACIFSSTLSLITAPIVAEIPSTRLKAKTVNLGRSSYIVVGIINSGLQPRLLNPGYGGIGARGAFIFAAVTFMCINWAYFFLPETKGFNFDITDKLFERAIAARNFWKEGEKLMCTQIGDIEMLSVHPTVKPEASEQSSIPGLESLGQRQTSAKCV